MSSPRLLVHSAFVLLWRAWGYHSPVVPCWQRALLPILYPLLVFLVRKSFRITPGNYGRAVAHVETLYASERQPQN